MRSKGKWLMIGGGAATILGGVFLWRGWARYKECKEGISEGAEEVACTFLNAPLTTGMIMTPLALGTFTVGGALALIESGSK
jgi:hypothetical protein